MIWKTFSTAALRELIADIRGENEPNDLIQYGKRRLPAHKVVEIIEAEIKRRG